MCTHLSICLPTVRICFPKVAMIRTSEGSHQLLEFSRIPVLPESLFQRVRIVL